MRSCLSRNCLFSRPPVGPRLPVRRMFLPFRMHRDLVLVCRDNMRECIALIGVLRCLHRGVPDPWVLVMITYHAEWAVYWTIAFEEQGTLLGRRIEDASDASSPSTLVYGQAAEEAEEEVADADVAVDVLPDEVDIDDLGDVDVLFVNV